MLVVVDTSILIDQLRNHPPAVELLRELTIRGDELWSSTVVRTELITGMRKHEEQLTLALFNAIKWQVVTTEIADLAGLFTNRYRKSHGGIELADYLIAATAQLLDGKLLTLNVKHFPMFARLEPAY